MKKIIFISFCIFLLCSGISPVQLEYKFKQNNVLYIESGIDYNVFLNGEFINKFSSKEISDNLFFAVNDARTKITTRLAVTDNIPNFNLYKKTKTSSFSFYKTKTGKTTGLNQINGLHDFPLFPQKDLSIGESWINTANFVMPLFSSSSGIQFELQVQYRLLTLEKKGDDDIALISANAVFVKDQIRDMLSTNQVFTLSGYCNFLIKFNVTKGFVQSIEEVFNYFYVLYDYSVIEISGLTNSLSELTEVDDTAKVTTKEEIIKSDESGDKDMNIVVEKDRTITITLLNVQFLSDSKILLDSEKQRLDRVAKLIKEKYSKNMIIIIGHAASTGNPPGELSLSEERAKVVLEYLVKKYGLDPALFSYEGKGSTEPIADNNTEEGRAKNRRVEIRILPEL